MFSIITHLKFFSSWFSRDLPLWKGMQLHVGKARLFEESLEIVGVSRLMRRVGINIFQLDSSCTVGRAFMLATHAMVCFQGRPCWCAAWRKWGNIWYKNLQHDEYDSNLTKVMMQRHDVVLKEEPPIFFDFAVLLSIQRKSSCKASAHLDVHLSVTACNNGVRIRSLSTDVLTQHDLAEKARLFF